MHRLVAEYVQDSHDVANLRSMMNRSGKPPAQYAALKSRLDKLKEQLALTPLGLQRNRWEIVTDEVAQRREEQAAVTASPPATPRRRLKVAPG